MRVISTIVLAIFLTAWSHTVIQSHDAFEASVLHVHDEHHDHDAEDAHEEASSHSEVAYQSGPDSDEHPHGAHVHFSNTSVRNTDSFKVSPAPLTGILFLLKSWIGTDPTGLKVNGESHLPDSLQPTGLLTTVLRR